MVIWTDTAITDMTNFIDTAKKNDTEKTVRKYLKGLVDYADTLDVMNEMGVKVVTYDTKDIRQIIYKSHRIIYYLKDENIYILTVLHTKRELNILLKTMLKNGGK